MNAKHTLQDHEVATQPYTHIRILPVSGSLKDVIDPTSSHNCRVAEEMAVALAAHELLAALERILYAHDNHGNGAAMGEAVLCHHYAETARAAIAKAKGE